MRGRILLSLCFLLLLVLVPGAAAAPAAPAVGPAAPLRPGALPAAPAARALTAASRAVAKGKAPAAPLPADGGVTTVYADVPLYDTLTVTNPDGSVDTTFTGTVHWSSSDPLAVLPPDYTYTTGPGGDNGVHTFRIIFNTLGSQTLTASSADFQGPSTQQVQVNDTYLSATWQTSTGWPNLPINVIILATTAPNGGGSGVSYVGTVNLIFNGQVFGTFTFPESYHGGAMIEITFNNTQGSPFTITITDAQYPRRTTTTPPVNVIYETCTGPAQTFDGVALQAIANDGVAADISTQDPLLCGNALGAHWSDSSVWVMDAGSGASAREYAQAGYGRAGEPQQNTTYFFTEFNNNFARAEHQEWGATDANTHHYSVEYNTTTHALDMKIDGVTKDSTTFDPMQAWPAPWAPNWAAETHDPGDNVPGVLASPITLANLQIHANGSGWSTLSNLSLESDSPRYRAAWDTTNSQFRMWTQDP